MARKDLGVPYLSQVDNQNSPSGTCNLTSVAMVLQYFGWPENKPGGVQLEDTLYQYVQSNGLSRHDPEDLVKIFNSFASQISPKIGVTYRDSFATNGDRSVIKHQIDNGFPVIIHGYFTRSGHIIVIRGYDDEAYSGRGAFLVNDPWGEWTADGYSDVGSVASNLPYSYQMMDRFCLDPNGIGGYKPSTMWVHLINRN
jgi:uncharacterized protein YvpB